jgi:hypothetical protein
VSEAWTRYQREALRAFADMHPEATTADRWLTWRAVARRPDLSPEARTWARARAEGVREVLADGRHVLGGSTWRLEVSDAS